MASTAGVAPSANAGQVEYVEPGAYTLIFPEGVETFSAVGIAAGLASPNTTPFNGRAAGNLHWRNDIPVPASRTVTINIGTGAGNNAGPTKETWIKDGSTFLLRASNSNSNAGEDYWLTLGGGGGRGGPAGAGNDGNGGLGGGGPGYAGKGGRGGNYLDTNSGQFPEADSGGGRGGDANGVPTGWASTSGEGTGLLGRSPDKTTSLGSKLFGFGVWGGPAPEAGGGGLRILWGGSRSYPDNAPDIVVPPATFVSAANGSSGSPSVISFHTGAEPGDLLLLMGENDVGNTISNVLGITGMRNIGRALWKQITADDIAASLAGTVTVTGAGVLSWATAVYRGAFTATSRTAPTSPFADTVTLPGFTKHTNSRRIVLLVSDRDAGAANAAPAGFTSRTNRTTPMKMRISDAAPADYVNGANIVLTSMVATLATNASAIELT